MPLNMSSVSQLSSDSAVRTGPTVPSTRPGGARVLSRDLPVKFFCTPPKLRSPLVLILNRFSPPFLPVAFIITSGQTIQELDSGQS